MPKFFSKLLYILCILYPVISTAATSIHINETHLDAKVHNSLEHENSMRIFSTNPVLADILSALTAVNLTNKDKSDNWKDISIDTITCNSCIHNCRITKKDLKLLEKSRILIYLTENQDDLIYDVIGTENFKKRTYFDYANINKLQSLDNSLSNIQQKISISQILNLDSENDIENFFLNLEILPKVINILYDVIIFNVSSPIQKDIYKKNYEFLLSKVNNILKFIDINKPESVFIQDKHLNNLGKSLKINSSNNTIPVKKYKCVLISSHYNRVVLESNFVVLPEYNRNINQYLDVLHDVLDKCIN